MNESVLIHYLAENELMQTWGERIKATGDHSKDNRIGIAYDLLEEQGLDMRKITVEALTER